MSERGSPPPADRITPPDVQRLESLTGHLRGLDYRFGGGSCRSTALAALSWYQQLLGFEASDVLRARLCVALADLHNLTGWACFDTGMQERARIHFDCALALAEQAGNKDLVANILYRIGRVHLHHNNPAAALRAFRRGQIAARRCGSTLAGAILAVNQAWAFGLMAARDEALELLGRGEELFARADVDTAPPWARFFDETDLSAMAGVVYTELARSVDVGYTTKAIPALTAAVSAYGVDMSRSRAFCLSALALNHLLEQDFDHASDVGAEAVRTAEVVRSARTKDRLRPLRAEASRYPANSHVRDLADRITYVTTQNRDAAVLPFEY